MNINYRSFSSSKSGFFTSNRDKKMLDKANESALEWLKYENKIEVINITSTLSSMTAIVTVWYRE